MNRRWYSAVAGVAAVAAMAGAAFANAPITTNSATVTMVKPVKTAPLRDIQKSLNLPPIMRQLMGDRHFTQHQLAQLRKKLVRSGYFKPLGQKYTIPIKQIEPAMKQAPQVRDPVIQSKVFLPQPDDITAGVNFPGIGVSGGDSPLFGWPDTDMAVGDNDVVEIVNLCAVSLSNLCGGVGVGYFKVWDKNGNVVMPTTALSGLWAAGTGCDAGQGDNIVMYDQLANRWIMSQINNVNTGICVAVSATSDPTGSYYLYNFVIDPNGLTDSPKLGVWPDAYYLSTNDFNPDFSHVNFTALERSAMLAGTDAESVVINGVSEGSGGVDYSVVPAYLDGLTPPPAGDPGMFINFTSPYLWGTGYQLNLWQMTVDWDNPANSTLSGPTTIVVDQFNDGICGLSRSCIPEPSPGQSLDAVGDRLMFRLAYRNFGDHQAMVINQTVGTGGAPSSPPAGIRWYELDAPAGATNLSDWTVAQQGTYLPDDGNSRWMGSIAMDHVGNIGLGYNMSSSSLDPSAAFTGQNVGAPSGVLDAGETVFATGSGVEQASGNRWGSYSATVIDPTDDCTFWTSQEYMFGTGAEEWATAISAFKFDNCSVGPRGTLEGTVTAASSGSAIAGATVTLTPGNFTRQSGTDGHYSITAVPGTYSAVACAFAYACSDPVSVTIIDGGDTTQDFALASAPAATLGGKVTDSGHGYPLYAEVVVKSDNGNHTLADVWTNPNAGGYHVSLPTGTAYTVRVTPYLSGYTPGTATGTLNGNTRKNFGLTPDTECSAPGYAYHFSEDFDEGTFPPTGWTVTNDIIGSHVVWMLSSQEPSNNVNFTGGTGDAAEASSYNAAFGSNPFDTSLISPSISTAVVGTSPVLVYKENFIATGNEAADIDVSIDGGQTWTTALHQTETCGTLLGLPGCEDPGVLSVDLSSYVNGASSFQLRFRYYKLSNALTWYWQVDDITIGACQAVPGGLVQGQVADRNTHEPMDGATVADESGNSTTTTSANGRTGSFVMFEPTGDHTLTASKSRYQDAVKSVNVGDGSVNTVGFGLNAGQLVVKPTQATLNVPVGTQQSYPLRIGNTGRVPVDWMLSSLNAPPAAVQKHGHANVPLHLVPGHYSPASLRTLAKEGRVANTDRSESPALAPNQGSSAWTAVADYPIPVMDSCAATDEATGKVYSFTGVSNGAITAADYVYDPTTDSWSSIADFPNGGVEKPVCAMINGKVYLTDGDTTSFTPNSELDIYDIKSDTWSTGAAFPSTTTEFAAAGATVNGEFYVIGGCDSACQTFGSGVEVYDPSTDSWSTAADYPEAVAWTGCGGAAGDEIVCAGGITGDDTDTTDTYVYDPSLDSWTQGADMPYDNWGMSAIGTADGHFLVSLGITNGFATQTNQSAIYDVASDSWSIGPNNVVSTDRVASACGFYALGGFPGGSLTGIQNVEVLPGYDVCGVGAVPWLSFSPSSGTLSPAGRVTVTATIDGTGQTAGTSTTVQVRVSGNTPYGAITIPLTVNWTNGG